MPNKIEITISEKSDVKVKHDDFIRGNFTTFEFDNVVLIVPEVVSEYMRDRHNEVLPDKEYGYENMQRQLDEANSRIEELEYRLQHLGLDEAV
jgi:hypothetical protein